MLKRSVCITVCCVLTACAVPVKQMDAIGGSRADGTIKMAYEFGRFETPTVNVIQGAEVAKRRCVAWGYTGAERFGGQLQECAIYTGTTCERFRVIIPYQCIGDSPRSK